MRCVELQSELCLPAVTHAHSCTERNPAAQKLIIQYYDSHNMEGQPNGFKDAMKWLADASTDSERSERVLHVLASKHNTSIYPINWDWAYTFRRSLRKQAETTAESSVRELRCSKKSHFLALPFCKDTGTHEAAVCCNELSTCRTDGALDLLAEFVPFDDAMVSKAEAWRDARLEQQPWQPSVDGLPEPPNNSWLLNLTKQTVADAAQRLPNLVAVLNCLLTGAQAHNAGSVRFHLQPSALLLRYVQAYGIIAVLRRNDVSR